ncbi:hypothetical protein RQP46_007385 [Phenoliferia psychrophenolica]
MARRGATAVPTTRTRPTTRSTAASASSSLCTSLDATPRTTKRVQSRSPTSPSESVPALRARPLLRLDTLPADVLYRIAELLAPELSVHDASGTGELSDPQAWLDPGTALLRLALTCRVVYRAVAPRIGVHFGLRMNKTHTTSNAWNDALALLIDPPSTTTSLVPSSTRLLPPLLFHPLALAVPLPGHRIRHLFLHTAADGGPEGGAFLADLLLPHTPRLTSFAYVHSTTDALLTSDHWGLARIAWSTLRTLARSCPDLREVYFAGARARGWEDGEHEDVVFGDKMEQLTLHVAGDELCRLVQWAPNLKRIVVWREFTKAAKVGATEWWWTEDAWRTVEHVELRGFSGIAGLSLLQAAFTKLLDLRTQLPNEEIPLTSLRLTEQYAFDHLVTDVLPAISELPHLVHFSFLLWRTRHFNPDFIKLLASHCPNLEELGIGIESQGLHWWSGNPADFAKSLSHFPNLITLTWNHAPYADLSFNTPSSRAYLKTAAVRVAANSPLLSTIRWFGHTEHLVKSDTSGWDWSDGGGEEEKTTQRGLAPVAEDPARDRSRKMKAILGKSDEGFFEESEESDDDDGEEY